MERLSILAQYCPKGKIISDFDNLKSRGELIFSNQETDRESAAKFLVLLLHYIERWALKYPKNGNQDSAFLAAYR